MERCSFHGFSCGFSKLTRNSNNLDTFFQPEYQFDEEQVEDLRNQILALSDVSMRGLLPNSKLFHSSSSSQSWWEKGLPFSQIAGGVFFSTIPQLSIWGGKAPLGVTLQYEILDNSFPILYIPNRSLLLPILISLSGEEELNYEENLVGDDIIPLLNQLGFWGYYSCDECEIYLANEAIPLILQSKPFLWEDRRISSTYSIRR